MKKPVRSAAALALGSVLYVPSLVMAQPTLNVADTARLVAGGGAAVASVEITCTTETNHVYVNVTFLQRVGVETVTGRGGIGGDRNHITCNPDPQTVEVAVTSYDRIFQSGPVISQASIGECAQDFTACDGDFQTKSVELVQPSASKADR